jgi:hypothetical protein
LVLIPDLTGGLVATEPNEEVMASLRRLVDRAEIIELMSQYALALDFLDRNLYASCFTDPVAVDFGSFDFGSLGEGAAQTMSVDEWTDYCWRAIQGSDATHHVITNHHIRFVGDDEATLRAYVTVKHYIEDVAEYFSGGLYTDRVVRTGDGWRLAEVRFQEIWHSGNPAIFDLNQGRTRPNSPSLPS